MLDGGDALATASTALDTAIAAETHCGTAYGVNWSPRGIKNANWSTRSGIEAGAILVLKLTLTSTSCSNVHLIGLEMDYAPRLTQGYAGMEYDPPLTAGL